MISGRAEEPETPDYDSVESGVERAGETVLPAQGIHAFPGGMRAGTCLHLILEELDFADLSQLRPLVARKLSDFHFENFDEVVCDTLEKLLRVPLGEDGFTLSPGPARVASVGIGVHFSDYCIDHGASAQGVSDGGAAACDRSLAVRAGQRIS